MNLEDTIYSDVVEDTFDKVEFWKHVANDDELLTKFQMTHDEAINVSTYYEGIYEGLLLAREVYTIPKD